jgi:adenylate cyclase
MTQTAAVLFTDLVGFTAFTADRGDDAAVGVLDATRAVVDGAVCGAGGQVVKELGDGLMVAFPRADAAVRVAAALAASFDAAFDSGESPLAVRMGMHHGPVTRRGDDLVGHTVNVAARVVDLAGPGELLVSDEVLAACSEDHGVSLSPVGPTRVKGVATPIWLHRLAIR